MGLFKIARRPAVCVGNGNRLILLAVNGFYVFHHKAGKRCRRDRKALCDKSRIVRIKIGRRVVVFVANRNSYIISTDVLNDVIGVGGMRRPVASVRAVRDRIVISIAETSRVVIHRNGLILGVVNQRGRNNQREIAFAAIVEVDLIDLERLAEIRCRHTGKRIAACAIAAGDTGQNRSIRSIADIRILLYIIGINAFNGISGLHVVKDDVYAMRFRVVITDINAVRLGPT